MIRGSLDSVTPEQAEGWALSPDNHGGMAVQAMLNREIIGEAIADMYRSDLETAGFGDGHCAYMIRFYRRIDPAQLPFIVVRPEGSDLELPRGIATGYVPFFNALHQAYPSVGRYRSVYGGLWTDRTDAAAVLRGKLAIGQLDPEDAGPVGRLIASGVAVVPGLTTFRRLSLLTAELLGMVVNQRILRLLQGVLESNPAVLNAEILYSSQSMLQPSADTTLPSPAECLLLVMPTGDQAALIDVVRNSHGLPEFMRNGRSRWLHQPTLGAGGVDLQQSGVLDSHEVKPGSIAIIGPGVLHWLRCEPQDSVLRLRVVPSRGVPAQMAQDEGRVQTIMANGLQVWL